MPKAKTKRKGATRTQSASLSPTQASKPGEATASKTVKPQRVREVNRTLSRGQMIQSLTMTGMVALGCWGLAFTFIVFSNDANRYLFGGIAIIMALMWSISFSMRFQRFRATKSG